MSSLSTDQLRQTVEEKHGGTAKFRCSVPVFESFRNKTLWNGAVQVFDLVACPSGATRAYAWSVGLADGQRQSFAILHEGAVASARDAVRAVMLPVEGKTNP